MFTIKHIKDNKTVRLLVAKNEKNSLFAVKITGTIDFYILHRVGKK